MVRWVTIPEYQKISGLSRKSIKDMMANKTLSHTTTELGQARIKVESNREIEELIEELDDLHRRLEMQMDVLKKLCQHLGVNIGGSR